ncbi:MAG: c-type cytochrome [Gammaproteobacteria bacterium]|jgi:cytochrome c peroxidase|nr:c-type cytochrome [Gammaproteobacteria bacterium]MBT3860146.1 c-type cytochrome [Gammaproteobacteria bacterium]MBT3987438.1 c-type cytochrome [Gammaproteobacteria bacterium]MBT4581824.1 c-type cytochrome [Gammaproteobacteria bacterium]MBT4659684.1 c-type cytochrome [Gammaproteobacteria bacterium]
MKNILLFLFLSGAIQPALSYGDSVSQLEIESAWLAFSNARGEASLIRGDVEHPSANDIFRVIPDVGADSLDEEKLQLGFDLFREGRLSRDGSISCNSCHISMMGGVDRRPVSLGVDSALGTLNAPTIFNAALNFRQFWDGRALTLQEQALGPIENPAEFDHDRDGAVAVLKNIPDYVAAFDKLYPDGITAANLSDAIAYYETMNFTGLDSPFLRQFQDDQNSLSQKAIRGQQRFVEVGCASCHNGVNLGGNSYQQLGVAEPWYGDDKPASEADDGLFGRTGREQDRHVFKVPTLHNVATTGPWFHDGGVTSLQQAVDQMARHELGRYLENSDIDEIVAFLRSLGDSLGMVGDCSVSGNYGITLDCDVSQKAGDGVPRSVPILPGPAVLASQHEEEYSVALEHAVQAPTKISEEMQRIRSGQVAHYDFLQYEHIEMLRYARALSFPPANVESEQREAMLLQAAQWQQSADQYELIIADFLRMQAVASSARANYQDLLQLFSSGADEKTLSLLANAQQSVLEFYVQPNSDTQLVFESSTRALHELSLNPQRLEELKLQLRLLLENVSIPQV